MSYKIRAFLVMAGASVIVLYAAEAHPAVTAAGWAADPAAAAAQAAKHAKETAGMGAAGWTAVITGVLTVVGVLRQYGQFIPGIGPAWKLAMDGIWWLGQHKDARLTDKAQANIADAAALAISAIRQTREQAPEAWAKVPESIRLALEALQKADA